MRKVLIVEDDNNIQMIITDFFLAEGFVVDIACDGKDAIEKFDNSYSIVILDVMLPKIDGWYVLKHIRKTSDVPVIMLTAKSEEEDKLTGYDLKADGYITKPFSPRVLVAKAKILMERVEGTIIKEGKEIIKGIITIYESTRRVIVKDVETILTPKEFNLLCYLVKNEDIVLERDTILNAIWGYDYYGDIRVVDTYIKKLRKSLGEGSKFINTIHGVGYRFKVIK